ncbi:MAG: hypothetical protein DCF20_14320 [Pseudanabaena sp.]|nr:MAG: hypothetical protein DCF20_14320 [Pseudanabaena sp.]
MVQSIELGFNDRKLDTFLLKDQQVYAKSSAGRSGGGSFTRSAPSSSNSSSSSKSSNPSKSSPAPSNPSDDRDTLTNPSQPSSNRPSTIVAPVIINNSTNNPSYDPYRSTTSTSSNGMSWFVWIIILLIVFAIVYFIIRAIMMRSKQIGVGNDLGNETFTVSKLQVALFAQAREVQSRLTKLALEIDTDSPEGLMTLMQESALALVRTPENWTHVSCSSQSVHRDKAEEVFNKLSIEERTKFSEETLVNVRGRVSQRSSAIASPDKDPSAYIVVTLLIGTEHDQPLFGEIRNTQELRQALEAIASIPVSHLLVFELLWSPQADTDSLTYDELLEEYSNMTQI